MDPSTMLVVGYSARDSIAEIAAKDRFSSNGVLHDSPSNLMALGIGMNATEEEFAQCKHART